MIAGMLFLLVAMFIKLGGPIDAFSKLHAMKELVPPKSAAAGHQGWLSDPKVFSPVWWTLYSSLVFGVGVGVLAQPHLAVRCLTVKTSAELNRAAAVGGIFILITVATPYVLGALSNVFFYHTDKGIASGIRQLAMGSLVRVVRDTSNLAPLPENIVINREEIVPGNRIYGFIYPTGLTARVGRLSGIPVFCDNSSEAAQLAGNYLKIYREYAKFGRSEEFGGPDLDKLNAGDYNSIYPYSLGENYAPVAWWVRPEPSRVGVQTDLGRHFGSGGMVYPKQVDDFPVGSDDDVAFQPTSEMTLQVCGIIG